MDSTTLGITILDGSTRIRSNGQLIRLEDLASTPGPPGPKEIKGPRGQRVLKDQQVLRGQRVLKEQRALRAQQVLKAQRARMQM